MMNMWHLANIDWVRELPGDELETLRQRGRALQFERGATIFAPERRPKRVYILESGLVRIYRAGHSGDEVTLGYVRPGEVFGELAVFSEKPRESYAEATEPSAVLDVAREDFITSMRSTASVVFTVAAQIEDRVKQLESRIEDLVFRSALSRVAQSLLRLADQFGEPSGDHTKIAVRLTHTELAKLVGSTRPTVSIALGEFEDDGVVSRDNGLFVIQDKEALQAVAARERSD